MKSVVFDTLFELTPVMLKISDILVEKGIQCYWVVGDDKCRNLLREHGVAEARVCDIRESVSLGVDQNDIKLLSDAETASGLRLYQAVMMDRFLMEEKRFSDKEQLVKIFKCVHSFLEKNSITHVFAEPTNIRELILFMAAKLLGVNYLAPWDMRYPEKRLIFAEGILQSDLVGGDAQDAEALAEDLLSKIMSKEIRPFSYAKLEAGEPSLILRVLSSTLRRVKSYIKSSGTANSLVHYRKRNRLKLFIFGYFRRFYLVKNSGIYEKASELLDKDAKIAFFPIHVQPEQSIDVMGDYVSDQAKLIKDIRRSLPNDWILIVKEHTNALGQKPLAFYKKILELPGVSLVNPFESSWNIIKNSDLVLSVSGTSAYEAGMLGKNAITFSKMFFGRLPSVQHCSSIDDLPQLIAELESADLADVKQRTLTELQAVIESSYDAFWTDAGFDETVLNETNVNKLGIAFHDVIERT